MTDKKPHKGQIDMWSRCECNPDLGLGWYVTGRFMNHPQFANQFGHTSWIEAYDEETGEIETRNSLYTLV